MSFQCAVPSIEYTKITDYYIVKVHPGFFDSHGHVCKGQSKSDSSKLLLSTIGTLCLLWRVMHYNNSKTKAGPADYLKVLTMLSWWSSGHVGSVMQKGP